MTTELLATKLIQTFEGCRLNAYWDAWGKTWTIGWGHTKGVKSGDTCDASQASLWFAEDSKPLLELVKGKPMLEAAALVSFGYNCGLLALMRVIGGDITVDHEEFMAGDKPYGEVSGGVRLPGLYARRQLEAALIETSKDLASIFDAAMLKEIKK